jgi:hypothetical protein
MHTNDRPTLEAEDMEITPEMIAAGMEEYSSRWLGLRDADDAIAADMLRAAFSAMNSVLLARRRESHRSY